MKSGIYTIYSKLKPERFYIGSAVNLNQRKSVHFSNLSNIKHPNRILQNHFNKYGEQDLVFEILEYVKYKTKLIEREQFYIDELNPYFNICKVAGSSLGTKRSEEACKRNSELKKGNKNCLGLKRSKENKLKISEIKKGQIPWNKGIPCSEETKIKISKSNIGKHKQLKSKEHKEKIRLSNIGKHSSLKDIERLNKINYLKRKPILQFDLQGNFIKEWDCISDVQKQLGFDKSFIINVAKGKYKQAYNFIWKYK
jgi:group I intron endonuclease